VDASRLTGWIAGKTGACGSQFPVLASFLGSNTDANKQEGIHQKHTHRSSGLGPLNLCLLKGVLEATPDNSVIFFFNLELDFIQNSYTNRYYCQELF
jgi:hypothetical protein